MSILDDYYGPINSLFDSLNKNKFMLILSLLLIGIYLIKFNNCVNEQTTNLFDNNLFKLLIFVMITYISCSNPVIGIGLAIIILVSLQIITNLKLKKDLGYDVISEYQDSEQKSNEEFSHIEPIDSSYLTSLDVYIKNPLEMHKDLSPPTKLDLKLTTPTDYYIDMIKKGKVLLDDNFHMEEDLKTRFDKREKQIASDTKIIGTSLVQSGINRLQKADNGEYNLDEKKNPSKFVIYQNLLNDEIIDNPSVMASYNELLYSYDILVKFKNTDDIEKFNSQLNKVYQSELNLLETIYKNKKNNMSKQKQKLINDKIEKIKQLKVDNKDLPTELKNLSEML